MLLCLSFSALTVVLIDRYEEGGDATYNSSRTGFRSDGAILFRTLFLCSCLAKFSCSLFIARFVISAVVQTALFAPVAKMWGNENYGTDRHHGTQSPRRLHQIQSEDEVSVTWGTWGHGSQMTALSSRSRLHGDSLRGSTWYRVFFGREHLKS
jgi:hypothetical protein